MVGDLEVRAPSQKDLKMYDNLKTVDRPLD